jgi:excisionase family DNA binding protein
MRSIPMPNSRNLSPSALIKARVLPPEPATIQAGDICTVQEVCALLKVDKRMIYRAIEEGRLPVIRLGEKGRVLRVHKADLLQLRKGAPQSLYQR